VDTASITTEARLIYLLQSTGLAVAGGAGFAAVVAVCTTADANLTEG